MSTNVDAQAREHVWTGSDGSPEEVLVSPAWLTAHLGDRHVRVLEVDVSPAAYVDGHVDGAVLWNVYADLTDPTTGWFHRPRWKVCWSVPASGSIRRWSATATRPRWGSG